MKFWWVWHSYCLIWFAWCVGQTGIQTWYVDMGEWQHLILSYNKKSNTIILSYWPRETMYITFSSFTQIVKKKKKNSKCRCFRLWILGKVSCPNDQNVHHFLFQNSECNTKIVKWLLCWWRLVGYVSFHWLKRKITAIRLCSTNIPHLGPSENIFLLFILKNTKILEFFW